MNKKKWLSILLVFVMTFTGILPNAAAQAEDKVAAAQKQQEVLAEATYQYYFADGSIPGIEDYASNLYVVFSLIRAGYEAPDFYNAVYEKVEQQLSDLNKGGVVVSAWDYDANEMVETTLTEDDILSWGTAELYYAKIVLFLSALGKDATQVGGFNLIEKMASTEVYESSMDSYMCVPTMLLALDCSEYELPVGEEYVTRTELVNAIVDTYEDYVTMAQDWDSLDMAAMPLQALAPYTETDNLAEIEGLTSYDQDAIDDVCDRGLLFLKEGQGEDGLFGDSYMANNPWTLSQVMVVMGQFNISATEEDDDCAFIKNGVTVYDDAAAFVDVETGTVDESLVGEYGYAPEQLLRGLNACIRVSLGEDALYDTTECEDIVAGSTTTVPTETPSVTAQPEVSPEATTVPTVQPTAAATSQPAVTTTVAPVEAATKAAVTAVKIKKVIAKKGSKTVKGTVNVSKAKVTVTLKRGNKKVSLPVTVKGKTFTATLTKKAAAKLTKNKKKLSQNRKLKKGDKITLKVVKKGYQNASKTVVVK